VSFNLEIGLLLLQELVLIALPAVAAAWFAASRGMRSQVLLIGIGLASTGAAAMLVFWGFYATPDFGKGLSVVVEVASAATIVALWFGGKGREAMRELLVPAGLWVLASYFVLYVGFIHGSGGGVLEYTTHRFTQGLPTDNELPNAFAGWFYEHGHHGTPPEVSTWLASDRPPLQIAYTMAVRPFGWDTSGLRYELLALGLQTLWIPGAWALLRAVGLGRRARGLALIAAMVSDVAIVNTFYVWPKLIAAAFTLAAAAMVLAPQWKQWAREPGTGVLFAALFALAMLSHGSSIFVLVPVLVVGLWRALPNREWIIVAVAAAVVLYAPWQAYQHWGDPPGNRLVKWQIGGEAAIDERGVLQTIADEYGHEGVGGTLGNKVNNLQAIAGVNGVKRAVSGEDGIEASFRPQPLIEHLRLVRFFSLLPMLGFLLLGPLLMAFRAAVDRGGGKRGGDEGGSDDGAPERGSDDGAPERGAEWRFAIAGGLLALGATAFWALVMFGNSVSETVIHQGSLALPILAIAVCVAAAYAVDPRFAIGLVIFNALFVLALYVPAPSPAEGTSYSVVAFLVAAIALAAFCRLAWRAPGTVGDAEYTPAP
jgi:hypothetical protein